MSLQQRNVVMGCGLSPNPYRGIPRSPTQAGRRGGILQQTLSQKPGQPGRANNGGIIASGTPIRNPGRIAAGAEGIPNPRMIGTFAPTVYRNILGQTPGGLVDKRQQIDPRATVFSHPFAGGAGPGPGYRSIASQMQLPALTSWNGFITHQADTPLVQPHERGAFWQKKITSTVKTQFGVNATGQRPDTAFQRQPRVHIARPQANRVTPTEKISGRYNPPSFMSHNTLRVDPTNFNSTYGFGGRWATVKRSANE